jgi:hypothetical protein
MAFFSGLATIVATLRLVPWRHVQGWVQMGTSKTFHGLRRLRRVLPAGMIRRETFSVGCFDYPPLSVPSSSTSGTPLFVGPWPRLMQDVADILGFDIRLTSISASDFEHIRTTKADFVVGMFETPARRESFEFSAPFHRIRLQGICRRNRPKITKEELSSGALRIAVQSGEVGWEYVQDQLAHLSPTRVRQFGTPATFEVIGLLLSGDYDVAICDEISCLTFLQNPRHHGEYQLAFEWPSMVYSSCIAVRKSLFWSLDRLNAAMKQARNDPAFLRYEDEWLSGPYADAVEKCYIGAH